MAAMRSNSSSASRMASRIPSGSCSKSSRGDRRELCYNLPREFAYPISGEVMAPRYLIAVALGLSFVSPARSADLKKYLPNDASAYIHINVKQLFTAPVIRKAVPMAFEKYGDQIMPLVQMAKAFNPNTPDIPEAQVKKGIEELKKEET